MTPTLTINVADPLTTDTNPLNGDKSLSKFGHVWITLNPKGQSNFF